MAIFGETLSVSDSSRIRKAENTKVGKMTLRKLLAIAMVLAPGVFIAQAAHANVGCVKNNGGYVAKVTYYKPGQVYADIDSHGKMQTAFANSAQQTYLQQTKPTLGFKPCAPSTWSQDGGLVTVSVAGVGAIEMASAVAADVAVHALCYGIAAAAASTGAEGAAVTTAEACHGVGVMLAAATTAAAVGVAVGHYAPDSKEVFVITTIPKGCELRVKGTAFSPTYQLYQIGSKTHCPTLSVPGMDAGDP